MAKSDSLTSIIAMVLSSPIDVAFVSAISSFNPFTTSPATAVTSGVSLVSLGWLACGFTKVSMYVVIACWTAGASCDSSF